MVEGEVAISLPFEIMVHLKPIPTHNAQFYVLFFSNRYVLLQACEELGGNRIAYG
jgi:hypothetical protein